MSRASWIMCLVVLGATLPGCTDESQDETATAPAETQPTRRYTPRPMTPTRVERPQASPAEQAAARLKQGEPFEGDVQPFLEDGELDPDGLAALARALRDARGDAREEAARALIALGKSLHPLHARGGDLIEDPRVLEALVKSGLSQDDPTRDLVLETLEASVKRDALRPFGQVLCRELEARPGPTLFLVIARAKPARARRIVEDLRALRSEWADDQSATIAQAALGDTRLEDRFLSAFRKTVDPKEKARLAKVLGRIGTDRAMKTLAAAVRTPLVRQLPMAEQSVRLDVLAALDRNVLDEPALWGDRIRSDEGYARAEAWCQRTYGVTFAGPRPRFLTVAGRPHID